MVECSHYESLPRCYVIAEIGVNHNGNTELAKEMIVAAKEAGADAVKFQTFTAKKLVTPNTPKVTYQTNTTSPTESHYQMIERLELNEYEHHILKQYCDQIGIDFISTPYDLESIDLLERLEVTQYKTASADLVDLLLHEKIAKTGKPVIISVGMASLEEIEETLNIYKNHNHNDIILLHCVSNYPCALDSLNLNILPTLRTSFHCPVGYSDHSVAATAAIVAVALGAVVIEKHFTLGKSLPGPDHRASSTTAEFTELVDSIRDAERALGKSIKCCQKEENKMQQISRKSVTLARDLSEGEVVQKSDLVMMRPGSGLMAKEIPNIVGKKTIRPLKQYHQPAWIDLCGIK